MQTARSSLILVLLATSVQAQSVTITPIGGGTIPQTGELLIHQPHVYYPGGPPDSIPVRYRFGKGLSLGALVEVDARGPFGVAALVSLNLSSRNVTRGTTPLDCRECDSQIYGLGILATGKFKLTPAATLHLGLGPELLHLDGGAVSNDRYALPPHVLIVTPQTMVGAIGTLGWSYTVGATVLRVQLGYRYFAPRHVKRDQDIPWDPTFVEKANEQLLFSVGAGWRPGVRR
jgi:hypothetical protein